MKQASHKRVVSAGAALLLALSISRDMTAQVNAVPVASIDDPQVKDDLFEGLGLEKLAVKAKESNEVSLDKNMLAMAASGKQGGKYSQLAGKMELVNIRNYEFAQKGVYSLADLDVLRKKLDSNGWSHVVRNRDENEVNDICVRTNREGQITEILILNAEPQELNLVHLKGQLSMQDLKKFGVDLGEADPGDAVDPKLKHR